MHVLILLGVLLAAAPAVAASFNCQKAETATERAICGDQKLSSLDERAVAAYTSAAEALGLGDADFRNPMTDLLLRGHQDWTAARNRCASATNCLLAQYLRRIAVLTFHPDPQAHSPVDAFIGQFGTSVLPEREMVVMRAPGDAVLVRVTVTAKDWSCDFSGIGRLDRSGALRVTRPDFDGGAGGDHTVLLKPTRLGLSLTQLPGDNVASHFCGAGGLLEEPYPRRTE
jgi:uncharacterized protein